MAWTQADADAVQAAVLALASGTRATMVSFTGPPARQVQYAVAELPQLRALLAEIQRYLAKTPTFRRVSFSKGFDPPRGS